MTYIAIDGDDIGRRITALYLRNDPISLGAFAAMVQDKTQQIARMLRGQGFTVIFCAADGVVAHSDSLLSGATEFYPFIRSIGGDELTFSVGVGRSLREAYVALLAAKSNGKAQMVAYGDMI